MARSRFCWTIFFSCWLLSPAVAGGLPAEEEDENMGFGKVAGSGRDELVLIVGQAAPLVAQQKNNNNSGCDFGKLMKCFMGVVGQWGAALYEHQENVVSISTSNCDHLNSVGECVDENRLVPELSRRHNCSQKEIYAASTTVQNLLSQNRKSGSFLNSYYMLNFSCSTEGRRMMATHRQCLEESHVGAKTLDATTYLHHRVNHPTPAEQADGRNACDILKAKMVTYESFMLGVCAGEAYELMCESIKGLLFGSQPATFADCSVECRRADLPPREGESAATAQHAGHDTTGATNAVPLPFFSPLLFVTTTTMMAVFFYY